MREIRKANAKPVFKAPETVETEKKENSILAELQALNINMTLTNELLVKIVNEIQSDKGFRPFQSIFGKKN